MRSMILVDRTPRPDLSPWLGDWPDDAISWRGDVPECGCGCAGCQGEGCWYSDEPYGGLDVVADGWEESLVRDCGCGCGGSGATCANGSGSVCRAECAGCAGPAWAGGRPGMAEVTEARPHSDEETTAWTRGRHLPDNESWGSPGWSDPSHGCVASTPELTWDSRAGAGRGGEASFEVKLPKMDCTPDFGWCVQKCGCPERVGGCTSYKKQGRCYTVAICLRKPCPTPGVSVSDPLLY